MKPSTPEYYTFEELRALGCPNELLIQYVLCAKEYIDEMLEDAGIRKDISECRELVLESFDGDTVKTDIWFYTKNPHLGHIAPVELIHRGLGDKVMAFITNAIEENKRADCMDKYLDDRRASLSDAVLLRYFKIILAQAKDGHDREEMLLKYINELEYRGLKYKLDL